MARAFTVGRRPLVEYLDHDMIAPNVDNTMTRFLAYPHDLLKPTEFIDERHDDEILGAALERLGTFDHVGLVEDPDSLAKLGRWLECEVPDTRLNERSSVKRFDLEAELRPAAREALAHRTRLDRRLWSQVARQALPDADPDAVLAAAWDKSISRYEEAMRNPGDRRPLRRTVEVVYGLAGRLRSPAGGRK
jgi:hypothetical protein